jgi:hypothetical protein
MRFISARRGDFSGFDTAFGTGNPCPPRVLDARERLLRMDSDAYVYTFGMTDAEVDETLAANDTGVLSLADDGTPYAVPVSYHYDGESIWLRLSDDGDSEKMAFLESTTEPCLLVYGVEGDHSWSILIRGELRRDDDAFDLAALRESFGPLRIFDENIDEVDLALFELVPRELTARRTD